MTKLSVDLLWQEFAADPRAASTRYFGKAIDITGKVTSIDTADSQGPYMLFAQTEKFGVRANLLADRAAETMKDVQPGTRINLKCFCEGLNGHVILRSCVRP